MGNLCDSVVGIGVKNTEAIEIKDIRSLELELRGDALLMADGDQVTRLEGHSRFQDSNILELGIVSEISVCGRAVPAGHDCLASQSSSQHSFFVRLDCT